MAHQIATKVLQMDHSDFVGVHLLGIMGLGTMPNLFHNQCRMVVPPLADMGNSMHLHPPLRSLIVNLNNALAIMVHTTQPMLIPTAMSPDTSQDNSTVGEAEVDPDTFSTGSQILSKIQENIHLIKIHSQDLNVQTGIRIGTHSTARHALTQELMCAVARAYTSMNLP